MFPRVTNDRIDFAFADTMKRSVGDVVSYEELASKYELTKTHRIYRLRRMLSDAGRLTEVVPKVGFKLVGSDRAIVHLSSHVSSATRKMKRGIRAAGSVDTSSMKDDDRNRLIESLLKAGNVAAIAQESGTRIKKLIGGEAAQVNTGKLL